MVAVNDKVVFADIAKCYKSKECPKSPKCFRSSIEEGNWQNWFSPGEVGDRCSWFLSSVIDGNLVDA